MSDKIKIESYKDNWIEIEWFLVPWDTVIFEYPIVQISSIKLIDESKAYHGYSEFVKWCNEKSIKLVSCRLLHNNISESIFLESQGFRFIEMVLHPIMKNIQFVEYMQTDLQLQLATSDDIPLIRDIAGRAFYNERYHIDPRVENRLANLRYKSWVDNAFSNVNQEILIIKEKKIAVGFFIWEKQKNNTAYWHLTAINPDFQGKGYGRKAWLSILNYHKNNYIESIRTTISARNVAVLNLYSSLNFRFEPPEMTFHWLCNSKI